MLAKKFRREEYLIRSVRNGKVELGVCPCKDGSHIVASKRDTAMKLIAADKLWERSDPSPDDLRVFANNSDRGNITWFKSKMPCDDVAAILSGLG